RENFKAQQLYGCGTSFGGYLLLKYIAENDNPFTKIALRCPAVNMYETTTNALMVTENLKTIQKGKPVLLGFDRKVKVTKDFIDDLKKSDITQNNYHSYSDNMLIVQGNKDEVVSYEVVKTFAENNGIPLETVQNADHRFSDPKKADTAISLIISFLS
ncbi:MAG: prolyl oligopeptidase family serine peptidase, partial [Clostridia bacterium]|nr:prolyl oligopeptidase family serine peptidase [Clostridia bacterium]